MRLLASVVTSCAVAALMACTPADTTSENTESEATEPAASTPTPASAPAMPETPYTDVEQQMHQAMMQAQGQDAQETFALKMIEHHRGAVQMSEVLLTQEPDAELRRMAEETITRQRREIEMLEAWVARHREQGSAQPQ